MKIENPAVAVCPFRAENGLTIKLKIDPDDNRHVLTWYINGEKKKKNAVDNIQ